jgi:hypothetical protein
VEGEEKAKIERDRYSVLLSEVQEKAKDDPKLARQLEAIRHVMEENSEALQKLANS